MKKRIPIIAACFMLCANGLFAQITKDSLVNVMAKEVCIELNKNAITNSSKKLEETLSMAFMPAFTKYANDIIQAYGFTEMNETNGEKVGRDIGAKLGTDCPVFAKLILNNTDETKELLEKTKTRQEASITGTLIKINNGDITFLELKLSSNKIEKIYWLDYFDGSNKLLNNALLNKKITITYTEKEIYKSSIKEYVKTKIITGLTIE